MEGNEKFSSDVQFFNVRAFISVIAVLSAINAFKALQSSKAFSPILFTLAGSVISLSEKHPLNASFSIVTTLSGIAIFSNLLQFSNALFPIDVRDGGNKHCFRAL